MADHGGIGGKSAFKRYDDLLRAAVDWVWECDAQFLLTSVTESFAARLGYASVSLRGKPLATLVSDRLSETVNPDVPGLADILKSRRSFRQQAVVISTQERESLSCALSGVPFYDEESGAFSGYRGTGQWVHDFESWEGDRGEAHRRLLSLLDYALEQKDALERESQGKDSLQSWARLGAIAHELRTPLNAILGFSEIIRDWRLGDAVKRYREYGGIIHDSGMHLLDVVNDLLEITDKEKMALKKSEVVDLTKVASFVLIVMEERSHQIGVNLINALPPTLPLVQGERRAMRQILLNLVSNALRYTPTGGEVRIDADVTGDGQVQLHIRDTGIGIAPEEQEKVFDRYYRAQGSETEEDGKGLGLAISRQLARELEGDILLESRLGEGSCFTLVLPTISEATESAVLPKGAPDGEGSADDTAEKADKVDAPKAGKKRSKGRKSSER